LPLYHSEKDAQAGSTLAKENQIHCQTYKIRHGWYDKINKFILPGEPMIADYSFKNQSVRNNKFAGQNPYG
jgi:hypothetical protein